MKRELSYYVAFCCFALAFVLVSVAFAFGLGPAPVPPQQEVQPQPERYYKLMYPGSPVEPSLWLGSHITNDGMCTTIWLNNRADTIICGSHLITEIPPPAEEPAIANPRDGGQG